MKAIIDTNILVQYIVKTDKKSIDSIIELVKIYDEFIITQSVLLESIFILEYKLGLSRDDIDKEIFCLLEDLIFVFELDFDIYSFLSLYTSYKSLDIIDIFLLLKSKNYNVLTLDIDLNKKIKSIKI